MDNDKHYEIEVLQRLSRIETLLENFKNVEAKANEAYMISKANQVDINKLKENNQWLFRTSIGAMIGAFISMITTLIINFVSK